MADPTTPPAYPAGETRPPALPSTADAQPYVPVSWPAVAAAAVAAVFVLVLLVLGWGAYRSKKPLIAPEVLILPVVAWVLCFVAARLIRSSEGTRTGVLFGMNLPKAAAWVSGVLFLVYGTYLLAIDYSIRQDAKTEVTGWVELIAKPDDPAAPDPVDKAFLRTLPPANRGNFNRLTDRTELRNKLQAQYREELAGFRQSDLIQLVERNRDTGRFEAGGLRDWQNKDNGVECIFTGTFRCAEGSFPVAIPLKGIEGGTTAEGAAAGRQWQVVVPYGASFLQRDRVSLTPYGWLLLAVERSGVDFCQHVIMFAAAPAARPYVYHAFIADGQDPRPWGRYVGVIAKTGNPDLDAPRGPWGETFKAVWTGGSFAAGGGPTMAVGYTPAYQQFVRTGFLKHPAGGTFTQAQRDRFAKVWNEERGIVPPGGSIKNNPDVNSTVIFSPGVVELRLPVEIPFDDGTSARARLVAECRDPALLAELQSLRASADPDKGTNDPPQATLARSFPWRVARIESDLYSVRPTPGAGREGSGAAPQ